ncbi:hypothetical protein ACJMK2_012096 [Sinanodonta woodiana]|uniref:NACHT domain-containing protein n=1 Tax=Sinanodonta woodiana TaxID=1069815 RepID=A0ABD3V735_SINWO
MVDMLWGVPDELVRDPFLIDSIREELRHCQRVSIGPNFVAFLGQKYGLPFLPTKIESKELEKIKMAIEESGNDSCLIDTWYKEDQNVIPSVCRLQQKVTNEDSKAWSELLNLLQLGAKTCVDKAELEQAVLGKYFNSELEQLVQEGLLDKTKEEKNSQCIVYTRDITNISQHLNASNANYYVDLEKESTTPGIKAKIRMDNLKEKACRDLSNENLMVSTTTLSGGLLNGNKTTEYLGSIGTHFFSSVKGLIDKRMEQCEQIEEDSLCHEVALHWNRAVKSHLPFVNREDVLNNIKGYLLSETDQPFVVRGETGSGKTTVIAKAAYDINEAIRNTDLAMPTVLISRFLGESSKSTDCQQLLLFLCHQLAYITGRCRQEIPSEYKALKFYFIDLLQRGEYGGMIILLLDSLEQLSAMNNGHKLEWLPPRLAPNVKVIVTVSSESKDLVRRLENKVPSNIVEITKLSRSDCENLLKVQLNVNKRALAINQWKHFQKAFAHDAIPLKVNLLYAEAFQMCSYDSCRNDIVTDSMILSVNNIFNRLENKHGNFFVSRCIGYITAAKNGLSESELEDLLSLDDEILNNVYLSQSYSAHARRIPPRHWSRLRQDLKPYLTEKETDGIAILNWRYRILKDIARMRYLENNSDTFVVIHSNIADYYLGTWSGSKKKPFQHPDALMAMFKICDSLDEACRFVPHQALVFDSFDRYNERKMSQLPFSLVQSGRHDELKREVFCKYEWLCNKLKGTSVEQMLSDFSLTNDREVGIVADALRISQSALKINPDSLGTELTGRLLPHLSEYDNIRKLIYQIDLAAQRFCPLLPNCQIYSAPGGPLQYECDIGGAIRCPTDLDMITYPDGIMLTAKTNYSSQLQVWDVESGDQRPDMMIPCGQVYPTRDGKHLNVFQHNGVIKTYTSDSGVQYGEVEYGAGVVADIEVSNKYIAFSVKKEPGPYVVDIEKSEILHKFGFHTHAVAISEEETYVAFNSERNILLFELPVMQRRCIAQATGIAHDIIFINEFPKCYVFTKSNLIEAVIFDVINKKSTCKTVLSELEAKECVLSNSKALLLVRSGRSLVLIDTVKDEIVRRFQKLPPGIFVDNADTFSGAGFTVSDEMIVATKASYLIIWETNTGNTVRVLQSTTSPIVRLFTSAAMNKAVTVLRNNSFQVWDLDNLDRYIHHATNIHQSPVKSMAISSRSGYIVSCDKLIPEAKLVSLETGKIVETLQHTDIIENRIIEVLMSPDGEFVVTRSNMGHEEDDNGTFQTMTDDILWEVESATRIYHATSSRYVLFGDKSDAVVFVTYGYYSEHDWSENIYNIFIVEPETSSNRIAEFPYETEFVSDPCVINVDGLFYFAAIIQTCQDNDDRENGTIYSTTVNVRLLLKDISVSGGENGAIVELKDLVPNASKEDQFLSVRKLKGVTVLVVYAKQVKMFTSEYNRGTVLPNNIHKGAVIYDLKSKSPLKHMPDFLDPTSAIESLRISSQYSTVIDGDLRVFKLDTNKFVTKISSKLDKHTVRLALDGRYVIGASENLRQIVVVRTSDGKEVGSVFVHGRAACLEVADDDRTVVIGCEDGRILIMSLIYEFSDPMREFIEKLNSRRKPDQTKDTMEDEITLLQKDIRHLSKSTPDLHRMAVRNRMVSTPEEGRLPSYNTLSNAVLVTRHFSRATGNSCTMQ